MYNCFNQYGNYDILPLGNFLVSFYDIPIIMCAKTYKSPKVLFSASLNKEGPKITLSI